MNHFHRGRRALALGLLSVLLSAGAAHRAQADVPNVTYNAATGHWYKYIAGTSTWAQSKAGAVALGGYLVTYADIQEITWTLTNLGVPSTSVWIGGSDNGSEGSWYWANGDTWLFTNWNTGEPNNSATEDYLMMYTNSSSPTNYGKWNDANAVYTLPGYIVEWSTDPNPPPPPVVPAAPTNLTATLSYQGTVLLAWSDNAVNETTVQVERMAAGGSFTALATLNVDAEAHEDTSVAPDTGYAYRVRAVNSVGPSGWSNEATVTSGPYAPTTPAPSDLVVVDVSPGSVDLAWTDRSDGETGFEIHRRRPGGTYAFLFKTVPDAGSYHDAAVSPDTAYDYAVRSVGTIGTSGFLEATATTDPTLVVTAVRGDLKDSAVFGKDSIKATAGWAYMEGVSDGQADPVAEGITVRAGGAGAPVVLTLPPGAEGWKGRGAKWTWKNPKGGATKYAVQVDLEKRLVTVSAVGVELAAPPANPVRFSVAIGDDAGTEFRDWAPQKKPGLLKLR